MSIGGGGRPPFEPPVFPYERLVDLKAEADARPGGCVDLSIGTPCDPPPAAVTAALGSSDAERGYPPSVGTPAFRQAAAGWMARRLGVTVDPADVAACIGSKEFVATLPQWLRLRAPDRDTVLYPAISYPTYEMGATLAGCRAVPFLALDDVDTADADRALCVWVNSPANPSGDLVDLVAAAGWGRARGIPVVSDECYVEFTWDAPPRTILEAGPEGVVALHSLSKRSNLAGARAGFYAGDAGLVRYLSEVRKHAGFLVPGPVQAAAAVAFGDDDHVEAQRGRYRARLQRLRQVIEAVDAPAPMPAGAFYLWAPAPGSDAWGLTKRLAVEAGALVSPGEFYGPDGAGFVRVAAVQPDERIELIAERLGLSP
ncbi:MAG: aminotransferase class I/II-fold pyridoxal phosphate-dependent enzyme [Acidimicrobiales bacterium]